MMGQALLWLVLGTSIALALDWSPVTTILKEEVSKQTMPGAVAIVGDKTGVLYSQPIGRFTYGKPPPANNGTNPPTTLNTKFDLASLTKVLATTTCIMILYQKNDLDLNMKVSDPYLLGKEFGQNGKEDIAVMNLLLHNAGFPPDPVPAYWSAKFDGTGCEETSKAHPQLSFNCRERIYNSLLKQTLINPVGAKYVYSDLSFITAMFVVGKIARTKNYIRAFELNQTCVNGMSTSSPSMYQCYYEAFVRRYIVERLQLSPHMGFRPSPEQYSNIAPTWDDDYYRHEQVQGVVSDENSYALGGIAGHAGLFASIEAINTLVRSIFFATEDDPYINKATVKYFVTVKNVTQSSRALGWDTNNYAANTYRGCGDLSQVTFTHTGYTGTQVCCDVERGIYTILLTNRCYPFKTKTLPNIHVARQRFNNAVKDIWDKGSLRTE